jgi:ribosomal protein S12 methylthiotransferase accessory factor YcaO
MRQNQTETIAQLTRALAQDFQLVPLPDTSMTGPTLDNRLWVGLDRPVFLAVAWPLHDRVTGLKPRLPAGRGTTPQQALVATGAEALELRACLAQRHLPTLSVLPRQDGLAMMQASDLFTGQAVAIPAQEVFLDCAATLGEGLVCDATSTGCAAGPTRAIATQTALWECIERDALALWWHGRAQAYKLPLDLIDRLQPRLFWWLEGRHRVTRLLDLTTDIGLPVVAAVSSDKDGRHVALGAAARPMMADAALAAVTEMVQTEVALEEARSACDPEALIWDVHASTNLQPQFRAGAALPPVAPSPPPDDLLQRLSDLGLRALVVDLTLPEDPLPTVRVLVPGLCAMGGRIDTARFRQLCPANPPPTFPEPY